MTNNRKFFDFLCIKMRVSDLSKIPMNDTFLMFPHIYSSDLRLGNIAGFFRETLCKFCKFLIISNRSLQFTARNVPQIIRSSNCRTSYRPHKSVNSFRMQKFLNSMYFIEAGIVIDENRN